jgi:two-component system response regulator RegA
MNEARKKFLVVDDDVTFRTRLVRALAMRGLEASEAGDATSAVEVARRFRPGRAIVDLRMPGKSGVDLIPELVLIDSGMQILVLTGYGSIATAVEAVRRGAIDYLSKPADTEQILAVFEKHSKLEQVDSEAADAGQEDASESLPVTPPSLARVEYEHIQRILSDCGGNISEAARRLGIHRRSLQRKLSKLPPLE